MIQLALRMGRIMAPRSRFAAWVHESIFGALQLYPPARDYVAQMKYKPKPKFHRGFLLSPESTPTSKSKSTPKQSLVGKLFPQALVLTAAGFALLDDVLGDGFVLLAPPGTPPQTLESVCLEKTNQVPIRRVAVLDKEDASAVDPPTVAARDLRGDLAALLAAYPAGLYLLRPDRYVAAFFPTPNLQPAGDAIARLIRETWTDKT